MGKMFIQDTTLTNIADAIREKTNTTASIFPENMPAQIRSIQTTSSDTTGIPEDIVEEANRVANGMISKMGSNSLTFIAMSDTHEKSPSDDTNISNLEKISRGNKNAGQAAKLISDKIPLDFFAHLGDFSWGGPATTIEDGVSSICKVREYIADVANDNETFFTPGNHDNLKASYSVNNEYLSHGVLSGLTGDYRYKDFDSKKVRVICLNTADNSYDVSYGERVSGEQLQWFCQALDLSAKNNAADWGIVILSHHPLDWCYIKPAANILAAYLDGTNYSATHDGVAVSYNFSGKNVAKIIAQFHGHVHGFKVDYINDFRTGTAVPTTVNRLGIPNACYERTNEYGENGKTEWDNIEFGEETSYEKTDDSTGKNTSFCLVSIDLDEEVIYADCFGAGYDRIVSYASEEIVTYTITNNLSNANTSNTTSSIVKDSNYTASITVSDGYELNTITVIMKDSNGNAIDITSTAVSGSKIAIANVTGDVVITVTTTKITPYTVSYDLANVDSSNMSTETASNTSYSTTLTANEGYSINFVRVLMGGIDVTSDVYENNNIDIETVTGDIDIIAGYYTNLVPMATTEMGGTEIYNGVGYFNGKYVSDENIYGTESTAVATGHMIMTKEDIIYVKGAEFTTGSRSRFRTYSMAGNAYVYSSDGVNVSSGEWLSSTGTLAFYIEQLGDEYYKITPNTNYFASMEMYFRISLYGTGEQLIVTKNEPIHEVESGEVIETCTVTNELMNVSTSNSTTIVNKGSSYSATLTAHDGYELKSVVVTMGGSTVAVTGGTINIDAVTGDIVITAVAEEMSTGGDYTNLVLTAVAVDGSTIFNGKGYKDGTYASAPHTGTDSACVTTGFIRLTNDVEAIYVKGAQWIATSNNHCRLHVYSTLGSASGLAQDYRYATTGGAFTVKELGTNYYKFIPTRSSLPNEYWYCISLVGTGENLIITHNEPIE